MKRERGEVNSRPIGTYGKRENKGKGLWPLRTLRGSYFRGLAVKWAGEKGFKGGRGNSPRSA